MVTSSTGNCVLIGGSSGSIGNYYSLSDELYEMNRSNSEWIPLKQKLQHARAGHVAMDIPEEFTNCNDFNDWQHCTYV